MLWSTVGARSSPVEVELPKLILIFQVASNDLDRIHYFICDCILRSQLILLKVQVCNRLLSLTPGNWIQGWQRPLSWDARPTWWNEVGPNLWPELCHECQCWWGYFYPHCKSQDSIQTPLKDLGLKPILSHRNQEFKRQKQLTKIVPWTFKSIGMICKWQH